MSLLYSREILNTIKEELSNAACSIQIITAYCKMHTLHTIMQSISDNIVDKKIIIRFRLDDLIKGSSDFEVLETCLQNDWDVYVRFDLHAKTYIVDNIRGIVGSANLTNSGMALKGTGNFEIATLTKLDENDICKISKMYDDAIKINPILVNEMKKQYLAYNNVNGNSNVMWDKNITSLFTPHIETLFSHELPSEPTIQNLHYVPFLDQINDENTNLKECLRWSPAYMWLLKTLKDNNGCMYFGELSKSLHDSLVSDPKPYRKDVKIFLANLLSIILEMNMDEIMIDRPNHSQRIRLIDNI